MSVRLEGNIRHNSCTPQNFPLLQYHLTRKGHWHSSEHRNYMKKKKKEKKKKKDCQRADKMPVEQKRSTRNPHSGRRIKQQPPGGPRSTLTSYSQERKEKGYVQYITIILYKPQGEPRETSKRAQISDRYIYTVTQTLLLSPRSTPAPFIFVEKQT